MDDLKLRLRSCVGAVTGRGQGCRGTGPNIQKQVETEKSGQQESYRGREYGRGQNEGQVM